MLSRMGGMDVEEIAETDPEAIVRVHVDPLLGFQDFRGPAAGLRRRASPPT